MSRSAWLIGLLVVALALAPSASAQPAPLVVPVASKAKLDVGDAGCAIVAVICAGEKIAAGIGGVVGGGVETVAGGVMDGASDWVAKGASWLLEQIADQVDRSTKPALASTWFQGTYATMAQLAIALAPLFLLLAVGQAILHQQLAIVLRALAAIPLALILTFTAVTIVQLGLGVTDWLTAAVLSRTGDAPADAFRGLAKTFTAPGPTVASFVMFLTALLMVVLALAVWVELALREAAIYVAVAFLPLTFVAAMWRPTAVWCRRLAEGLAAIILSKFALAVAFSLAAGALGESGTDGGGGLSAIVAGGAVLLLAAFSPFVLMRMIPLTQAGAEQGLNRQQVSGAARSAPGATTASGATRMLMYGKFTGKAAPPSESSSPTPPSVPAAAVRGASDVPVAVIPDPAKQPMGGGPDGRR